MSTHGLLRQRATIERATPELQATGEVQLTWVLVASAVPCALQLRAGCSAADEPGLVTELAGVAYLPSGMDIRPQTQGGPGDRLVVAGAIYRVVHVRALGAHLLRAEVRREA